jgi:hypoxanthine-guanine phosphoribosyltransferase
MSNHSESSLSDQTEQIFLDLAAAQNPEVTDRDKMHRLQDLDAATNAWISAYDNLALSENERLKRLVISGKILVVFRRIRKLISLAPDASTKADLLTTVHDLADILFLALTSSDPIEEPPQLQVLVQEAGNTPIAAMMQNVQTITELLPKCISLLNSQKEERLIRHIFIINCITDSRSVLSQIAGKRIRIVTAMSSGAMIMPFFREALQRTGIQADLEICCPEVTSPWSTDKFNLSNQVAVERPNGEAPDILLVLDDVVNEGKTIQRIVAAMRQKYGTNIPIIAGTKMI